MNELTFDILKIVVSACAALITVYVVPYIKTLMQDKRYESIMGMVEIAVRAIEQTRKEQGQGKLKKAEVETFITEWLTRQGIKITEDELNQLIECAVFTMKQETR